MIITSFSACDTDLVSKDASINRIDFTDTAISANSAALGASAAMLTNTDQPNVMSLVDRVSRLLPQDDNQGALNEFTFNDHRYTFFEGQETWTDAKDYCERSGGYLASITSQEENDALYNQMLACGYESAYFGLFKNEVSNWEWISGEPVEYLNWSDGEPNNEGDDENYAMFYWKFDDGRWNDGDFNEAHGTVAGGKVFICEWGTSNDENNSDKDGDGLLDSWEINGVDVDEDGNIDLPLKEMGADPNKKDIFVEVDWMVKKATMRESFILSPEKSYRPTEKVIRPVYDAFQAQGINLHVDAGRDSIMDFDTGKKWGDLSGGNEILFTERSTAFTTETFDSARHKVFRYAQFINSFNEDNTSGIAPWIEEANTASIDSPCAFPKGGRFFWVCVGTLNGSRAITGTFMHELGHTLGLGHGGIDSLNYKPNYLSVMNYSFQFDGFIGTKQFNYSKWLLPSMNESGLIENVGYPAFLTDGTGVGTTIKWFSHKEKEGEIVSEETGSQTLLPIPLINVEIDFNKNGDIDSEPVRADISRLNEHDISDNQVLHSNNDWEDIVFMWAEDWNDEIGNGEVRNREVLGASMQIENTEELTIEEALETDSLGNPGAGSVECEGPFTVLDGQPNQKLFVDVHNLSSEETTFTLNIAENEIADAYLTSVTVPASTTEISKAVVPIPLKGLPKSGEYVVSCTLSYSGRDDVISEIPVTVYAPSEEEIVMLNDAISNDDTLFTENVRNQYKRILEEFFKESGDTTDNQIKINTHIVILLLTSGFIILSALVIIIIILIRKKQN
jgi:hypothetical protein